MITDILVIIFLMGAALGLILVEIFLLPGFTIAGIGGILFTAGGLLFAYGVGETVGHVTLGASVVVFLAAFVWLLRSKSFHKVSLHTEVGSRLTSARELNLHPGDEGITLSRLAPIGKVRIRDVTVEAKSAGGFINEQTPVEVIRIDGYQVQVVEKDDIIHP
ncbi:MAG: hypothetical protein LBD89_06150 [Tannerellaceae bacterium]|jgi:membrane-bound ClpP family serine protease|nr:hypothetical protein [Tannerellaceae bacterium]